MQNASAVFPLIIHIRRPLPSLGLGGAAPGITVGARHGPVPALASKARNLSRLLYTAPLRACMLCHGTSLGPTSCFYCASKLLRGTFWAPLKTLKTSAAFKGLRTSKPSAAAFEGVPPALPWYLPRPHKLFPLGFETATCHVLGTP